MDIAIVSWELFLEHFHSHFLSDLWRQCRADEFHDFRQRGMTIEHYDKKLSELRQYSEIADDDVMLVQHFIRGLNDRIGGDVWVFEPKTMEMVVEKA